jgi:hypothetical protein
MENIALSKMPTVGIAYGFGEGWLTGRRLRKALRESGMSIARVSKADIIITHSGGFRIIPKRNKAKLLLLVNPSNRSDIKLTTSLKQKLHYDYTYRKQQKQLHKWLYYGLRNDFYILKVHHTALIIWTHYRNRLPPATNASAFIVRNRHDSYCSVESAQQLTNVSGFVSLYGSHDDLWYNPHHYADIVKSLYHG